MKKIFVSKTGDLADGARQLVREGDLEIGVYRRGDELVAYRNLCIHQGGPACEGITMHKVIEVIRADKTSAGLRFDMNEEHIVCPWHGVEYDLKSGACIADPKRKLRKYDVVTEEGNIYVLA